MCTEPVRIHAEPAFYLMLAVALLLIPIPWVLSWILASILHELGHCAAIRLCGYQIQALRISCKGATIYTESLLNREWFCALSGPLVGFLLFAFVKWIPKIAICGVMQSLFNLLPIEDMDGSRVLRGLLGVLLSEKVANRLVSLISVLTIMLLLAVFMFVLQRWNMGGVPFLLCIGLLADKVKRKIPCKDGLLQVQ